MPTSGRYVKKTGFKTRIRQCSAIPTAVVVVAFVVVVFTVVVVLVVVVVVVDVPIFVVVDVPVVGRGVVDVPIVVVVGGVPVVGRDVVDCAAANRIIYNIHRPMFEVLQTDKVSARKLWPCLLLLGLENYQLEIKV